MKWTLAAAKDKLSEVIRKTAAGPQAITVRGQRAAVVLSPDAYDRLVDPDRPQSFKDWLLSGPKVDLEFERRKDGHRDVEL